MNLSKEQREKIAAGIQVALLGAAFILAVKEDTKGRQAQMKKLLKKEAKRAGRLDRKEYQLEKALLKKKYKNRMQAEAEKKDISRKAAKLAGKIVK